VMNRRNRFMGHEPSPTLRKREASLRVGQKLAPFPQFPTYAFLRSWGAEAWVFSLISGSAFMRIS